MQLQYQSRTKSRWWNAFRHANAANRSEFETLLELGRRASTSTGEAVAPTIGDEVAEDRLHTRTSGTSGARASPHSVDAVKDAPRARPALAPVRSRRERIVDDVLAGITVALVGIPQCLAYAQLAGVPAYFGLYAALLPTIVGALLGSSRQLSTGPSAISALLTATSVAPLAALGSGTYIGYVVLLGLLAGVIQLILGLLRAGVLLNFLSHPVLIGFVNAAALIIGLSQLPTLLGVVLRPSEHFLVDLWHLGHGLGSIHPTSLGFGIAAFAVLVALKRFAPRLPGMLITVGVLTWLSYAIDFAGMGGRIVGTVPLGLPQFGFAMPAWSSVVTLAPAALLLALLSFMEVVSSAKIIAIKTRQPWNENRELIGQGLAKVAAAACQTMPVSGSFSRSALNLACNAHSQLSSIVAALCVLVTLLVFAELLHYLPLSVLAASIIVSVAGLIDFGAIARAWRANRDDGAAAITTFGATLLFAPHIEFGIVTGILLSLALLLYRLMRPRVVLLYVRADGRVEDAKRVTDIDPRIGAVSFEGDLRFVNVSWFEDALLRLEQSRPSLAYILVKANGLHHIDASGVDVIANLVRRLGANGVTLAFCGINATVREVMDRTGLTELVGSRLLFGSEREALDALRQVREHDEPACTRSASEAA